MPRIIQDDLFTDTYRQTLNAYADPKVFEGLKTPTVRALSQHSLDARERNENEHRGRKALILDALSLYGPMTDRQLRDRIMGESADMNTVRPRISDLISERKLQEVREIEDPVTHETVRMVYLT